MSSKTVHVLAKWQVRKGELETLLTLLMEVVRKSMEERGNLYFKVHQSSVDPHTLLLLKGYTDDNALAEHRNSQYFQNVLLEKIVPLLEQREVIVGTQLMVGLPGVPPRGDCADHHVLSPFLSQKINLTAP